MNEKQRDFLPMMNAYEFIGLDERASETEVEAQIKALQKISHPDLFASKSPELRACLTLHHERLMTAGKLLTSEKMIRQGHRTAIAQMREGQKAPDNSEDLDRLKKQVQQLQQELRDRDADLEKIREYELGDLKRENKRLLMELQNFSVTQMTPWGYAHHVLRPVVKWAYQERGQIATALLWGGGFLAALWLLSLAF